VRKKFPSLTQAQNVDALADDLQTFTLSWAKQLFRDVPHYTCQHYLHKIVHHAHQQLRTRRSIGLYSSCSIEATHPFLKKLTRCARMSGKVKCLSAFLFRRWRAKVKAGRALPDDDVQRRRREDDD